MYLVKFLKNNIKNKIYVGIKGQADLYGSLRRVVAGEVLGQCIEIEVKTGSGKLTEEQEKWKKMCLSRGYIYVEARSIQDVLTTLQKYT